MQHVVTNPETLNADTDNKKLHDLTKNFNASIFESGRVFMVRNYLNGNTIFDQNFK
jgi:hypothetical protein